MTEDMIHADHIDEPEIDYVMIRTIEEVDGDYRKEMGWNPVRKIKPDERVVKSVIGQLVSKTGKNAKKPAGRGKGKQPFYAKTSEGGKNILLEGMERIFSKSDKLIYQPRENKVEAPEFTCICKSVQKSKTKYQHFFVFTTLLSGDFSISLEQEKNAMDMLAKAVLDFKPDAEIYAMKLDQKGRSGKFYAHVALGTHKTFRRELLPLMRRTAFDLESFIRRELGIEDAEANADESSGDWLEREMNAERKTRYGKGIRTAAIVSEPQLNLGDLLPDSERPEGLRRLSQNDGEAPIQRQDGTYFFELSDGSF
ncbi:hypothetical protein [Deinococcus fonticola]|uniref:hypothetical protein n=1 Tax=Deinococcus fonticola TaxID=2528713 RepID=UPI0010750EF5|nr:hypothetical protein [Deinococcus fonticola]